MRSPSATGSNIALSFLDVLAGAIGAVVLLFIAFAALQSPKAGSKPHRGSFIRMEWTVRSDQDALLRLLITPPMTITKAPYNVRARGHSYYLNLTQLGAPEDALRCHLPGTSSYSLLGFDVARAGGGTYLGIDNGKSILKDRVYILRLHDPAAQDWKIEMVYFDRADGLRRKPDPINVSLRGSTGIDFVVPLQSIAFGGSFIGPPLWIDEYGAQTMPSGSPQTECKVTWVAG